MQYMDFEGPNFKLQTPTNWYITSSPQFQALFVASIDKHEVRPNLAVSIRPVEETVTVTGVGEEAAEQQAQSYPQYEPLETIDFTENGGFGYYRKYKWFNEKNQTELIQIQTYFVIAQILFTLTATTPVFEDGTHDEMIDIFNKMIESFRITVPE